jgi:dTDP-4-dehydrorhamnose 3,5-epimerase
MKATETTLPGVFIIEPAVFGDDRGFFMESFNAQKFRELTGANVDFVQDNHSRSGAHVLRGIHYQIEHAQGKLVRVTEGAVFDVAVDLRRSSPSFGQWVGMELSAENKKQLWVPAGFGHAFLVLSETADFLYKTTDYYHPEAERSILWNDADIGIQWPLSPGQEPRLSGKDSVASRLSDADVYD